MGFTIRELETLSGIRAHTIRIWEQRYGFLKPSRTATNIRTYSNEELKTLLTVALLNKYGYKISRIDQMHQEERTNAALQLPHEDAHRAHLVNEMIGCMVDLNNIGFEALLNRHIAKYGIEQTITQLIFSFLEKVGLLWQTSRIVPVQEHIVSNIIRQKIVSAIEQLPLPEQEKPLFLLLLPEDEHHELGLLFVHYLLRRQRLPVIYLGANVPVKDVGYLMRLRQPDHIYLHLTSFPPQHSFQKYIHLLAAQAGQIPIHISGSVTHAYKRSWPEQIQLLKSFMEVTAYISSVR